MFFWEAKAKSFLVFLWVKWKEEEKKIIEIFVSPTNITYNELKIDGS